MKNLFCPKIHEIYAKSRDKPQKSAFLAKNQKSVPRSRLETMVLMGMQIPAVSVQRQIASGVDLIVHLGRLRDRSRKVLEITEIVGYEKEEILLNPLFVFEEEGEKDGKILGTLVKKGNLKRRGKLLAAGYS